MPIIEKHHVHPYSNAVLFHSGHRPDLPPGRQSRLTTSENGRVCLVFKSAFIHSLILQWRMTFRATVDCCPARRLRRILAAIVWSSAVGHRGTRPGGADLYKAGAPGWERGTGFAVCGENLASVSQFVAGIRHSSRMPRSLCKSAPANEPEGNSAYQRGGGRVRRARSSPNAAPHCYLTDPEGGSRNAAFRRGFRTA